MSKGGFRPGAGRPPGEPKSTIKLYIRTQIADDFRATIPEKERSNWIEELIVKGLKKFQKSL